MSRTCDGLLRLAHRELRVEGYNVPKLAQVAKNRLKTGENRTNPIGE